MFLPTFSSRRYNDLGIWCIEAGWFNVRISALVSWPNGCHHGPQEWPWWHLFSVKALRLAPHRPSTAYRLWLYVRKRAAINFDIYFARRSKEVG